MIAPRSNHFLNPRRDGRSGFTLTETMVALTIGAFIMAAVMTTYIMSIRSFQSLANYWEIHAAGRRAVDRFSSDIRAVSSITSLTTSNIVCVVPTAFNSQGVATTSKTVGYYLSGGTFYRTDSTVTGAKKLASNIYLITFKLYDKLGNVTTSKDIAKSIQLDIKLRKYAANQIQSEDYLSARLVMRNKP